VHVIANVVVPPASVIVNVASPLVSEPVAIFHQMSTRLVHAVADPTPMLVTKFVGSSLDQEPPGPVLVGFAVAVDPTRETTATSRFPAVGVWPYVLVIVLPVVTRVVLPTEPTSATATTPPSGYRLC
jgi:hypothetical protein